jgi:polypeptide N-acetylgalactosaminyltransferase
LYAFNKFASDQISVKREMPDTRHSDCRKIDYDPPDTLPNTSVILIFCNEALSVLLRSVVYSDQLGERTYDSYFHQFS